jgi:protein-disulfide isomerase/uncharacterized membrane protein
MSKPSRQKPLAQPSAAPQWAEPPRLASWLLAAAALAGITLAATSTWVHHQVTTSTGGYTSFCNFSSSVNCDTVVTSRYGKLLFIPVSLWAIGYYVALLALALRAAGVPSAGRDRARADALAWAVAGSLFSAYLAIISAFVLKTLCLLCAGLYVVSVTALLAAVAQALPLSEAIARLRDRWDAVRSRPAISAGVVGGIVGVFVLSGWIGAQTRLTRDQVFRSNPQFYDWYTSQPIVDTPIAGGQSQGPENAPIQLVEFSDFECPHCAQAYVALKDLIPRYQSQIRFTHHYFPLSSDCNETMPQKGHEHACHAAIAADCAAQQGKFSPYVNLLFANQGNLDDKSLLGYAKQIGLDTSAFEKCLTSPEAAEHVARDVKEGVKAGVRSTPTFFINNRKIEGNMPFESWLFAFAIELDKG